QDHLVIRFVDIHRKFFRIAQRVTHFWIDLQIQVWMFFINDFIDRKLIEAQQPVRLIYTIFPYQGRSFDIRHTIIRSDGDIPRSEEHTSELQSRENLVCRLLLEKKKKNKT